jgi:N,N'-diacetyllegionaminate synthase
MPTDQMLIGKRSIGIGQPCWVIAEAGVNHNGDITIAHKLIDAAYQSGADAVKFQTYRADKLVSPSADKAGYQKDREAPEETQLEMLKRLALTDQDFIELKSHCDSLGIEFLSSPFDEESVEFLASLGIKAFKVPSGEITNLPLLRLISSKRTPVILSTGMSWLGEIEAALQAVRSEYPCQVAILHCVSSYPAPIEDTNLRAMQTLSRAFGLPVGFSDHSLGIEISLAAATLGAVIIEKHLTLDRTLKGPDHAASLLPEELKRLTEGIRTIEKALGNGMKRPMPSEAELRHLARKSVAAASDIDAGAEITAQDIAILRPAIGIEPMLRDRVIGRRTRDKILAGSPITWDLLL